MNFEYRENVLEINDHKMVNPIDLNRQQWQTKERMNQSNYRQLLDLFVFSVSRHKMKIIIVSFKRSRNKEITNDISKFSVERFQCCELRFAFVQTSIPHCDTVTLYAGVFVDQCTPYMHVVMT